MVRVSSMGAGGPSPFDSGIVAVAPGDGWKRVITQSVGPRSMRIALAVLSGQITDLALVTVAIAGDAHDPTKPQLTNADFTTGPDAIAWITPHPANAVVYQLAAGQSVDLVADRLGSPEASLWVKGTASVRATGTLL